MAEYVVKVRVVVVTVLALFMAGLMVILSPAAAAGVRWVAC